MTEPRTALVVDEDPDLGDAICDALGAVGFDATVARTGADALSFVSGWDPDLVTLELSLPDLDGVELCRRIREVSDCYVVVITTRVAEDDRVVGLAAGADDYLVKPFSVRELQARVAGLLRRPRARDRVVVDVEGDPAPTVEPVPGPTACEHFQLDPLAREALVAGDEVDLTRTEFDLLAHLVGRAGRVVGRGELLRSVWAIDHVSGSTHLVDVHVGNLRRKLRVAGADADWIATVRGVGFRFHEQCHLPGGNLHQSLGRAPT